MALSDRDRYDPWNLAKRLEHDLCSGPRGPPEGDGLGASGGLLKHLEAPGVFWRPLEASGSYWRHLGALGHQEGSGNIWGLLATSGDHASGGTWASWRHLGVKDPVWIYAIALLVVLVVGTR